MTVMPMSRWRQRVGLLATMVMVVGGVSACSTRPTGLHAATAAQVTPLSPPNPTVGSMTWMLSTGALQELASAGLPPALRQAIFDRPSTILLGPATSPADPLAPKATRAVDFTSAAALEQALTAGRVPADVPDVVLDLEAWSLTPAAEQRDPIAAAQQALAVAQQHGKRLIFTPGVDLVRVLSGGRQSGPTLTADYERLLAGPGAAASDVFEVQAQATEGTAWVRTFAPSAVAAAQAGHPGEPVLVGLSTNASGRRVTAADVMALVQATEAHAAGYWLNIPQAGRSCPSCGVPQPQVAVALLEQLWDDHPGTAPAHPGPVAPPAPRAPTHGAHGAGTGRRAAATGSDGGEASSPSEGAPAVDVAGQLMAAGGAPADWVLAASQFAAVVGAPGVARVLGGGTMWEPLSARQQPSSLLPVVPTLVVHSEATLEQVVAAGTVPADVRAVLYDNERVADTPADEQADPLRYDQRAAALAAAHGWTSICDLVQPERLPSDERQPADEVPPCTVIGLNTVQQSERDPAAYAALVARDVALVHQVAPGRPVLAGLSANPRGGPVTAQEIAADVVATHQTVSGYWLNVPSPGVGCPACGTPDPGVLVAALQAVAGSGGPIS